MADPVLTDVERIKADSRYLRGTLADSLRDRHAARGRRSLLASDRQRRQPKVMPKVRAAVVALAQAAIVALGGLAHEARRDEGPLAAGGRLPAAWGGAGTLPHRHSATAKGNHLTAKGFRRAARAARWDALKIAHKASKALLIRKDAPHGADGEGNSAA